jgi:hypothetical protein
MVTQTIQFDAVSLREVGSGSITAELFQGSTSRGSLSSISEDATRNGRYTGTVTDQPAGAYDLQVRFNGFTTDSLSLDLLLAAGTYVANSGGGAGGDASQETLEDVQQVVDSIAASLAGSSPVEPTGRIANGGRVLAYVGDDFTVRSGTALPIPVSDPVGGLYTLLTAIGAGNLKFGASLAGKPAGLITGTIASLTQSGSGASQLCNITVEITNCGVGLKLSEDYEWQIQSTQTHGDETDTLIRLEGMLSLRRNVVG